MKRKRKSQTERSRVPLQVRSGIGDDSVRADSSASRNAHAFRSKIATLESELQDLREQLALERDDRAVLERATIEAQRELILSRERYANLYDNGPTGFVSLDRNGFIREANLTAATMLGLPRRKLLDTLLARFVVKDDRRKLLQHLHHCRRGGGQKPVRTELRATVAGRNLDLDLVSTPEPVAGKPPRQVRFRTALVDITTRKQAEEALCKNEEKFRTVVESAPNGILAVDGRGRIILVNEQIEHQFGYHRSELIGHSVEKLVPRRFRRGHYGLRKAYQKAPDARTMGRGRELFGLRKDGNEFPIEIGLNPTEAVPGAMVLASVVDITARKQAEAALRQSEEQFRRAIEEAPIPVIMHAEDGQVLQISRTWTELTGYRPKDIPTFEAWLNRAYGAGADNVRNHVHALFQGKAKTIGIEFPVRTRDGRTRHWIFSASAPGTLADGRRYVVGMALDITERRQAEEALRDSMAELERFNQRMVGRELRMVELKREVNDLCARLGQPPVYPAELLQELAELNEPQQTGQQP